MDQHSPAWTVEFYVDARGVAPALEFLKGLQPKERATLFRVVDLLKQFGSQLRLPYARHIEGDIWELRSKDGRLFYFTYIDRRFIVLHGYRKQGQKAPQREIDLAKRRRQEFLERENDGR